MENRREGQQPESGGEISLLPINQQVWHVQAGAAHTLWIDGIVSNLYHMYYIIVYYIFLAKQANNAHDFSSHAKVLSNSESLNVEGGNHREFDKKRKSSHCKG